MGEILLVISTSLISGLLATIITIICQKKSEKKKAKRDIFETLMSYRYAIHLKESVNALNKIEVVYYDNPAVIDAWQNFKREADRAAENISKPNTLQDKQLKLLEEMAKAIGYKKINWDKIKDFYFPQGLSSQLQEEMLLRKAQLQNTIQSNIQPHNAQLKRDEQIGMQILSKMIEQPNGIAQLIELVDKFGLMKNNNLSNKTNNKVKNGTKD